MGSIELLLRLVLTFFLLLLMARLMGRKEISQMTFFNFISAIAIGSISANFAMSQDITVRNGVIAITSWAIFTLLLGFLDIKSKGARKLIKGDPLIVIKNGKIMENALRNARLDIDSLTTLLRQKNVFSIADVDYAIFETNGKLSVMKKENNQSATKGDLNVASTTPKLYSIATEVISDGTINRKNLNDLNLNINWLEQQTHQAGIKSLDQVFYAELQPDGTLYIDKKDDIVR